MGGAFTKTEAKKVTEPATYFVRPGEANSKYHAAGPPRSAPATAPVAENKQDRVGPGEAPDQATVSKLYGKVLHHLSDLEAKVGGAGADEETQSALKSLREDLQTFQRTVSEGTEDAVEEIEIASIARKHSRTGSIIGQDQEVHAAVSIFLREEYTQKTRAQRREASNMMFSCGTTANDWRRQAGVPYDLKQLSAEQIWMVSPKLESKKSEIIEMLWEGMDTWGSLDIFRLQEVSEGNALAVMGWFVLVRWGMLDFFIDRHVVQAWLVLIQAGYHEVPYHSSMHAADVLQTVHFFLHKCDISKYLTAFDCLALILAAITHDYGHNGLTNRYHQSTMTERAIMANDISIQESYHVHKFFHDTLHSTTANILDGFSKKQLYHLRQKIIMMILGTDMSHHFEHLNQFEATCKKLGHDAARWHMDSKAQDVLLRTTLHLADISNPAKPPALAIPWAELVLEELFQQGDLEQSQGLIMSAMCDRHAVSLIESQIGFMNYITLPSYEVFASFVPEVAATCLTQVHANLQMWQEKKNNKGRLRGHSFLVVEEVDETRDCAVAHSSERMESPELEEIEF